MSAYWPDDLTVAPIGEWRTIPGFPDYEVSDLGQVRRATISRGKAPGPLKLGHQQNGYVAVNLYRDGRATRRTVHTLVWEAFVGPRAAGVEINHLDGEKTNNRRDNLEATTSSENKAHAARTGLAANGERNGSATLTDAQVAEIRDAVASGTAQRVIARRFGVSQTHVSDIARGKKRASTTHRVSLAEAKLREAGVL